jgi:hypothetical protein
MAFTGFRMHPQLRGMSVNNGFGWERLTYSELFRR